MVTLSPNGYTRVLRRYSPRRRHRIHPIPPGIQPSGFPRRIDTPHLGRCGQHGTDTQRDGDGDRSQRDRCLDRHPAPVTTKRTRIRPYPRRGRYTPVFNALSMIFVKASGILSPVTTPYSTAPNAAAAIVPIAYSVAVVSPHARTDLH